MSKNDIRYKELKKEYEGFKKVASIRSDAFRRRIKELEKKKIRWVLHPELIVLIPIVITFLIYWTRLLKKIIIILEKVAK